MYPRVGLLNIHESLAARGVKKTKLKVKSVKTVFINLQLTLGLILHLGKDFLLKKRKVTISKERKNSPFQLLERKEKKL